MTENQRDELLMHFEEVHDLIHSLYPRNALPEESDKLLRNRLLVVDLTMHLAQEAISTPELNEELLTERTVNLLHAIRLIVPRRKFD